MPAGPLIDAGSAWPSAVARFRRKRDFFDVLGLAIVKVAVHEAHASIRAVLEGDHARFAEVVEAFDAPVRRIVGRDVRDPQALEEVVQETWCRTYRYLERLAVAERLESWVGRIARSCVVDHFRERRRAERFVPLADDPVPPAPVEWVWGLVDQLEPAQREVLILRYRQQQSLGEIADALGVPPSTVRGRLFVARHALRDRIERSQR